MFLKKRSSGLSIQAKPLALALSVLLLAVAVAGCSRAEEQTASNGHVETAGKIPLMLPPAEADENALTVNSEYPQLASGSLVHARLAELPENVLLKSGQFIITRQEIDAEIQNAPSEFRGQLRKNAFFILEQIATQKLLIYEARQAGFNPDGGDAALLQAYFQMLVGDAEVSDREVAEFYEKNREMVGEIAFEQVREQIRQYLVGEKQQQIAERHIRTIAQRIHVEVSADWAGTQSGTAKDNPVGRARSSGRPSLVSFGADTCVPCQMMVPAREAVSKKYEGRANVVYVHVGEEQILASRYGVQGIPLLVFFDAVGREFYRCMGVMTQDQIEEQFAKMGVQE